MSNIGCVFGSHTFIIIQVTITFVKLCLIVGNAHTHTNTPMTFILRDGALKVIFGCGEQLIVQE